MRGRSEEQEATYTAELHELAAVLASSSMTVREIRDVLSKKIKGKMTRPAAATVYSRLRAMAERGICLKKQKRRKKIEGKSGQYEAVYSVEV